MNKAHALALAVLLNANPLPAQDYVDQAKEIAGAVIEDAHKLGTKIFNKVSPYVPPVVDFTVDQGTKVYRIAKEAVEVVTDLKLQRDLARAIVVDGDEVSQYFPKLGQGEALATIKEKYHGQELMEVGFHHYIGPVSLHKTIEFTSVEKSGKLEWKEKRTLESFIEINRTRYAVPEGQRIADGLVAIKNEISYQCDNYQARPENKGRSLNLAESVDAFRLLPEKDQKKRPVGSTFYVEGNKLVFGLEYKEENSMTEVDGEVTYMIGTYDLDKRQFDTNFQSRFRGSIHLGNPVTYIPKGAAVQLGKRDKVSKVEN